MKVRIIRIGNSKGIILNKTLLERYAIGDRIEIIMKEDRIELKPVPPPREGWGEAFKRMHELGDDELIGDDVLSDDILEEWEWE